MFLTTPAPFDEASEAIATLAPVDRDTFAQLLPELRDAAITIAGVEALDVVVKVRDIISRLPVGGDFESLKDEIEAELSPWLNPKAASKRATLLLRMHGFRAYAAAGYRQMEAHKGAFPFRQYVATMDEKTRHSHRALHGVVLPSTDPFWQNHTGPWAWGCRCEAVPLTAGAAERIRQEDAKRNPEEALVLEGPLKDRLDLGTLVRGPTMIFDVRTDAQRTGDKNAFEWRPGDAAIPLDALRLQYGDADFDRFKGWAEQQTTGDGRNLWDSLTAGRAGAVAPNVSPAPTPAPAPPPPTSPAPLPPPRSRATLETEALKLSGELQKLEAERAKVLEQYQAAPPDNRDALGQSYFQLHNELLVGKAKFREAIEIPEPHRGAFAVGAFQKPTWSPSAGAFVDKAAAGKPLLKHVTKGAEIVQRWVDPTLLRPVLVSRKAGRAHYSPKQNAINVDKDTDITTLAHEMVHPLEMHNPALLQASRDFLEKRAAGAPVQKLKKLTGNYGYKDIEVAYEDEWTARGGNVYAGKLYSRTGRIADAYATELLTMGIERLEQSAYEFHRDDPEYFWFTVGTLQKL